MENKSRSRMNSLLASFKACAKQGDVHAGNRIHLQLLLLFLLHDDGATAAAAPDQDTLCYLGNRLVSFYAKRGAFEKAQDVMECLQRDVVTWNALMSGYAQHGGYSAEVLRCLEVLQREGHSPNGVTFVCVLKACGSLCAVEKGMQFHGEITIRDSTDAYVGTTLVDMYAKCGAMAEAQSVFDQLEDRNVVSWTALIAGHVEQNVGDKALICFERMQREGLYPNAVTFVCVLKACGSIGASAKGKEIHDQILRQPLLLKDILIGTALVDMYVKCGADTHAQKVFDELQNRNVVCWNALITGYSQHDQSEIALKCFEQMQCEGVSPNVYTFTCILKACGGIGAVVKGKSIHADIVIADLVGKDVLIDGALVDVYARCGELLQAREVFDRLPARTIVGWSSLIAGYSEHGSDEEAFKCFERMQCEGLCADAISFLCVLKACSSSLRGAQKGKRIHAGIIGTVLLGTDIFLGNALMDMYAKCGIMAIAHEVFDHLVIQNIVSWTTLIGGYAQHELNEEALNCFEGMQQAGFAPNEVTFLTILKVCGSIGATDKGREIHADIVGKGLLETHVSIGNALIDMYGKCGTPTKAEEVFKQLPSQDLASWNALIAAYAQAGEDNVAARLFCKMVEFIQPDIITFTILLNACSHSGLLDKGQHFFWSMKYFGIIATLEHYTCMVDLFGRAGLVEKAVTLINNIPIFDHLPMWVSLLGACHKCGNVPLGRLAFEHAMHLDEGHPAPYVYMSNIEAVAPFQEVMEEFESVIVENGGTIQIIL